MSAPDILNTKLYIPPTRPELVSRPRLIESLDEGLHRKLTLISAPAGFGKSTLLSEWVEKVQSSREKSGNGKIRVAWLSLDEGDNAPARFLRYVIAALNQSERVEASFGGGALSMLQAPEPPPIETILTSLINELAALPDRIVLCFDDYHRLDSRAVDEALSYLFEHLPPQVHLVIATRDDPQLPLALLRARYQMTELRAADLRFTSSEAADFLNRVMGLDLSPEENAALERRTEGWIAGLQLAAISMRGLQDTAGFIKSFTGSHHFVLDYLVEEVLDRQSEQVQRFLVQTSILNRLSGALCDAITGGNDGQGTLEALERNNLFIIPLDNDRRWYRYHHLFADLLRQRLHESEIEQIPFLHHRASGWYRQNGYVDEAIEHALHGEDYSTAAVLIEGIVDSTWRRGEHTKLRRWLAGLPAELVFSKPHLCVLKAWDSFTSGQQETAERFLQAAERALETAKDACARDTLTDFGEIPESEHRMLQGRIAAIRAFLAFYRGDTPTIKVFAEQALRDLPEQDLTWRSTATVALGDVHSFSGELKEAIRVRSEALELSLKARNYYMVLISSMKLAVTLRQQGELERILEMCHVQYQLAREKGLSETVVAGWVLATWGEALAELGQMTEAVAKATKGADLTWRGRDVAMIGWSHLCLTRVLFTHGDLESANRAIRNLEDLRQTYHFPPWISDQMAAWQVRIWLSQANLGAASQWVVERDLDPSGMPTFMEEVEYIALARVLLAQERWDESITVLQYLLQNVEQREHISRAIEILILRAMAFKARGDPEEAIDSLGRALTLARPGGFIRAFVDEGTPMERLLSAARDREIEPDYTRRLLLAFTQARPDGMDTSKQRHLESGLVEPLSERELEVLELINEGLSNREIAGRLYLSLNTVKVHTRNIYGKLGVNNRTQAVARARELGVLPST